jgi:hypothetical protein
MAVAKAEVCLLDPEVASAAVSEGEWKELARDVDALEDYLKVRNLRIEEERKLRALLERVAR